MVVMVRLASNWTSWTRSWLPSSLALALAPATSETNQGWSPILLM